MISLSNQLVFLHLQIQFSKDSCITCGKKAFSILLQYFYLIIKLFFFSATAPLTTKATLIRSRTLFVLHDFLSRLNVFFPLFRLFMGQIFGTTLLFVERIV